MTHYEKLYVSMRYWLLGSATQDPSYYLAAEAMEYAKAMSTGVRKDGVTPEFQHQIEIAQYLRTLVPGLMYPAETLATAFLHDTREDYQIADEEIRTRFAPRIADSVACMTKVFRGVREPAADLFGRMAEDPIASVVKGADRIHNLQSMVGVFSLEKQIAYSVEVDELFFPMLKRARRRFVQQEGVYENITFMLSSQKALLAAIHAEQLSD